MKQALVFTCVGRAPLVYGVQCSLEERRPNVEEVVRRSREEVLAELAKLEQALADVRLERELSVAQGARCNDLVGQKAAWERDERVLQEKITALKARV